MKALSLAFLAGIVLFFQLATLPAAAWSWLLLPSLGLLLSTRFPFPLRLVAALAAGFLWALLHTSLGYETLAPDLEGEDLVVQGRIIGLPEADANRVRFLFAPEDPSLALPSRLRISWYQGEQRPASGERWRFTLRLKRPNGFQNPGGFDYEGWLFQEGVGATGYVRGGAERVALAEGCSIHCLRARIRSGFEAVELAPATRSILLALAIGDRSGIEQATWDVFLETGTNHLIAISGLHIGLVAGLVFLLFRGLAGYSATLTRWWAAPRWGALAGLAAATLYAALAGFSVPTQRALVMVAVIFLALLAGRELKAGFALAAALVGVLLLDPAAVLGAGYWLSFAAVAVLVFALGGRLAPVGRLRGLIVAQPVVAVGLAPWVIWWFQRSSLVSPLANLLAVPWVSLLVVPLTLVAALLSLLSPAISAPVLHFAGWLLELLWLALAWFASLPGASWPLPAPGLGALGLAVLGAALLLAPRGFPARWVGLLLWLPLLLPPDVRPQPGEARITLLDVGQGLAAVVETRQSVLVFDTGPRFPSGFNTGDAVIVPFLRAAGHRAIDTLVVSHGDLDHIGGLDAVRREYPVGELLSSVPALLDTGAAAPCQRGQRWERDGVVFEMLHPPARQRAPGNNQSCVLQVRVGERRVLFSGDIEARAEWELVHVHGGALASEVLIVPHHGSGTSSTDYFLDAVQPRVALIPAGYRNRYRLPKEAVVQRYRERGVELLSTAEAGAVQFTLRAEGIGPLQAYRETHARFWHRDTGL